MNVDGESTRWDEIIWEQILGLDRYKIGTVKFLFHGLPGMLVGILPYISDLGDIHPTRSKQVKLAVAWKSRKHHLACVSKTKKVSVRQAKVCVCSTKKQYTW